MAEPITARLDDDVHEQVLREHRETGKSKSSIVAERTRKGYERGSGSLEDSFLPTFGQALFVAGMIVPLYHTLLIGLGVMLVGVALVLGSNVDHQLKNGADGYGEAFKRAVGG